VVPCSLIRCVLIRCLRMRRPLMQRPLMRRPVIGCVLMPGALVIRPVTPVTRRP